MKPYYKIVSGFLIDHKVAKLNYHKNTYNQYQKNNKNPKPCRSFLSSSEPVKKAIFTE